jgi:uncharacterized membrane protein
MGPVQILVVGFGEDASFNGAALEELRRLQEQDIVRLIDLLLVRKLEDGTVEKLEISDRAEVAELGALIGALLGLGAGGEEGAEAGAVLGAEAVGGDGTVFDDEDTWYLADALPEGMAAAVVLIEHRWAIPLRNAIRENDGVPLLDRWLHPEDLVAAGVEIGREITHD